MPVVALPKQRHSMEDQGSALKVVIPSRKNYFVIFFLGIWLIGWACGEIFAGGGIGVTIYNLLFKTQEFLSKTSKGGTQELIGGGLFLLVWFLFWTAGGVFTAYNLFWQLVGKEIIEISSEMIKIHSTLFGFARKKEYPAQDIKGLRVGAWDADQNLWGWSRSSRFWGQSGGPLAFDYGAKTFRFGAGIDEAEATQVLEKILARFPQYAVRS